MLWNHITWSSRAPGWALGKYAKDSCRPSSSGTFLIKLLAHSSLRLNHALYLGMVMPLYRYSTMNREFTSEECVHCKIHKPHPKRKPTGKCPSCITLQIPALTHRARSEDAKYMLDSSILVAHTFQGARFQM